MTPLTNATVPIQIPFFELVSYQVREVAVTINLVFIGAVISVLGMSGNIINIIVFIKHGFNDTINISLVALSLADIGALIAIQWFIICVNPWFLTADLPFLPLEIQSLTAGFPHAYFTRVTGFISFERCMCVVLPMKVKRIITKRFVITYNVTVFCVMILTLFPVYYTAYYDWKFDPSSNKTKLGIFYTNNKDDVLKISLMINNFGISLLSYFIIIVSTTATGITLHQKAKWRRSTSCAAKTSGDNVSTKEKGIIVIITTVSVIFVVCLLPLTMFFAARAIEPELNIMGKYANINWLVISIAFLLETINSSINIVIYYKMSTKYRDTIRGMFAFWKR